MAFCSKCGAQVNDGTTFCPSCGAPIGQQQQQARPQQAQQPQQQAQQPQQQAQQPQQQRQQYQQQPGQQPYANPVPVVDPKDHTKDFDKEDISKNKVYAMLAYLFGIFGLIIIMIAAKDSKYAQFHARQAAKLIVLEGLLLIASVALMITIIVPFVAMIGLIIVAVVQVICFFNVCAGKAKEAPIVSAFKFFD